MYISIRISIIAVTCIHSICIYGHGCLKCIFQIMITPSAPSWNRIYIYMRRTSRRTTNIQTAYIYIYMWRISRRTKCPNRIYIYIYVAHIPAHNLGTMNIFELAAFSVIRKPRKTGPAKKGPAHRWRIPSD